MNIFKFIAIGSALLSSAAFAQGGRDVKPIPAKVLAGYEKVRLILKRGDELFEKKKFEDAIQTYKEAIEVERTLNFSSRGNYGLAKALTAAGRTEEALVAYKHSLRWSPQLQDFIANGPPFPNVQIDYAILLAKSGKADEAKAIYYSVLRQAPTEEGNTPIPFLVVFDPDPAMTVWEYTPEKFIAAAMMLRALMNQDVAAAEEVRKMEPGWVMPVAYLAMRTQRAELYKEAEGLAQTGEEKSWVRARQAGESLVKIADERRKASKVLNRAKVALLNNYERIAVSTKMN